MMIDGRKQLFYSNNLMIKIDPGLREQLAATAERERLPMSEIVRRALRDAIAQSGLAMQGGGDAHAH
jgi:predicted HicB family RNase H-like nuclease